MSVTQNSNLKCGMQHPKGEICNSGMEHEVNTMQQSRDVKRQETRSGWVRGFLIGMLWFQILLSVTEAGIIRNQSDLAGVKRTVHPQKDRRFKHTVNLLTKRGQGGQAVPLYKNNISVWMEPSTESVFKLEDNGTSLVVPKKGVYFVNLKLNFYISSVQNCAENLYLATYIEKRDSSYPGWINVIRNIDTMQCVDQWFQSVTLTQVARFLKGTKLRVIIEPNNYKFLIRDDRTYFSVTLL